MTDVVDTAKADVAKAVSQFEFVKANWTKLSIIVIASAAIGFFAHAFI
jgi:hypothetical protein